MNISNRSSAAAATARAAERSEASAANPANRSTPDRRRFALTGPSKALDHRNNAARRDLADIALAGRWFAPHYAEPESRSCGARGADILSAPGEKGARVSQLLPGEPFAVLEQSGDWAWGYGELDRYVGYVRADALTEPYEPTHIVTARAALAFAEPSSRAAATAMLPMGSRLAGDEKDGFLATSDGHVPLQHLSRLGERLHDPVAAAEGMAGAPYLWGGRGLGGIDCSGLVQVAFGLGGIALPRDSDQQMAAGREATGHVKRGDLLFFPSHVALMTSPDQAVHASGHWMSTVVEPLSDIEARLGQPIARRRVLP